MASIIKQRKSYRVQVTIIRNEEQHRISKTFPNKKDAELWALEQELYKGRGKNLVTSQMSFADYYDKWIHIVKRKDVREATFNNYLATGKVVRKLFGEIRLTDLNDLVVQQKIDKYAETHSRKLYTRLC